MIKIKKGQTHINPSHPNTDLWRGYGVTRISGITKADTTKVFCNWSVLLPCGNLARLLILAFENVLIVFSLSNTLMRNHIEGFPGFSDTFFSRSLLMKNQ